MRLVRESYFRGEFGRSGGIYLEKIESLLR